MASISKQLLSGSTNGKPIKVVQTGTTGTTVHTVNSANTSTTFDEVWLYAVNTSTGAVKLTLEWGTTTAADGNLEVTIPPEAGLTLVAPGLLLNNSLLVTAFAGSANVILIHGWVLRHA